MSEQLESMDEGDALVMKVFLEERFESYFKTVDEITKKMLAIEKRKTAWLQSECVSLVGNYLVTKRLMTEVDIEMKDLDVEDQKMLFRVSLCPEDVPMIKADLEKKVCVWLQAMPEALRSSVSDDVLQKTWKKEKVTAVVLKGLEVKTSQPMTPLSSARSASPSSSAAWSPEKTKKGGVNGADLEGASPCKTQRVVGAVEVDGKYTPLNALATIHKLRHHCIGNVLLVSQVVQIPVGATHGEVDAKVNLHPRKSCGPCGGFCRRWDGAEVC